MRVLQAGGGYLQRQESLSTTIALLSASGAAVAPLLLWSRPMVLLPVFSALLALGLSTWRQRAGWRKGALGEELVTRLLDKLPDDYLLVNDVMLRGARGNVDHVLVGPCGVLVIETKHYKGNIYCNGDWWWVNGRVCRSISKQANRGAAAVREYLVATHPYLRDSVLRYVRAVVAFTNPLCRLEVNRPHGVTVVRYSELLGLIRELEHKRPLPAIWVNRLAESLVGTEQTQGRRRASPA